ncbi:MAG TPA: glycoside hydrolase family 3 N-terminal domain-containing protein [Acidimicrobiales bacterium]|nr:glycoside hydrolase family 3 N-terminal domain-containing protein [Acidimicrobiales bacterium]
MSAPTYADASLSAEARASDLLERMDLEEKLAQLGAVRFPDLIRNERFDEEAALAAVPHGIGQVTRIGATTGLHPAQSAELVNQIQRLVIERTRLGIPVVVHEESLAGYCARDATAFPQALALACAWDPELVQEVAGAVRQQLLAVGARHCLAPVLDVARDPRWGRLEETYGEDPVLVGLLGAAYVRGMQTADLSQGVLATGKHFLAHGLSEGGRNHGPVQIGPRELREVYAEPFAAAFRAGLASVMSTYSCIDGLPGSGSGKVLTELLRGELGFEGLVVADYFAVSLLATYHRVAADRSEAAVKAITAGLDLELPALDCFGAPLKAAIDAGKVPVATIDTAVHRVLVSKFRLGLFEEPYVSTERVSAVFERPANAALARRAASRGIVLLTNNGVLPLPAQLGTLAVVGPGADDRRLLQGDYHYPAHQELLLGPSGGPDLDGPPAEGPEDISDLIYLPSGRGAFKPGPYFTEHVTPLAGLREALGPDVSVVYQQGCAVSGDDRSGFPAAVAAAASADVAVVVVAGRSGLSTESTVGEARDATDLRLTGAQEDLVAAISRTGTPTVVVVMSGRAHVLTDVAANASALLVAWPLGEQGGNALADVLLGHAEPCGRLAVTLPRATGQVPLYHSHRSGGARSMFYGDYTDCAHTPLFSFGHGLSYTTFEQSDIAVEASDTRSVITVGVTVSNTGDRAGEEVVQLYVSDLVASVARPEASLIGFARAALAPQQEVRVVFKVHPSRLAFFDEDMRFVTEPGQFRFATGASASDVRQQAVVALGGEVAQYRLCSVIPVTAEVGEPYAADGAGARAL